MSSETIRHLALVGLLIGTLATLVGGAILWKTLEETRWVQVEGTVLDSDIVRRVERSAGETGSRQHWTIQVRYAYAVDGRRFVGDRYASGPPRSPSQDERPPSAELTELLARLPVGAKVPVHVDPDRPDRSVLRPYSRPQWTVLAIGLALLFGSLAAWTLRGR